MSDAAPSNPGASDATETQRHLRRGLVWFGSSTLLARLANVASLLVVLRQLSSHELGLASLVLGTAIVFEAFAPFGIDGSIVQARQVSEGQYRSLHGFCIAFGFLLAAVLAALAPAIARFYREPALAPMLQVSGLKIVVLAFSIVPQQRWLRELDFRRYSVAQTMASMAEDLSKVALALLGFGAWSLIVGNLGRSITLLFSLVALGARLPRPTLHWPHLRPHLAFGARASLSHAVAQSSSNVDYFIVGRMLGAERLGIYRVAYDLAATPIDMVARIVYRVGFPLFARLSVDPQALRTTFTRLTRLLLLFCGPLILLLSIGTDDLLRLVGGGRWQSASPAVLPLACAAVVIGMERLSKHAFSAGGRPGLTLWMTLIGLLSLSVAIVAALKGVQAGWLRNIPEADLVAIGLAWIATSLPLWAWALWLSKRHMALPLLAHLRRLLPVLLAIVGSALLVTAADRWLRSPEAIDALAIAPPPWLHLALGLAASLCIYLAALRFLAGVRPRDLRMQTEVKPQAEVDGG